MKFHATRIAHVTSQVTVDSVLELGRKKHWLPRKIEGCSRKHDEGTASVSRTTVYRMLVEAGLIRPIAKPRRNSGIRRFERERSNNLWQASLKLTGQDE